MMRPKIRKEALSTKQSPFPSDFTYQPWLIQTFVTKYVPPKFINPFDGSIVRRKIQEMQGKLCLGYIGEWFLLLDVSCKEMFFLNLALDSKIHLPLMLEPFETLGGCVITSCPTSPKCVIIFVLKNQKFVLHCRPKDQNWKKVLCNFQKEHLFYGEIVMCEGKLYALVSPDYNTVFTDVESLVTGIDSWTIMYRSHVWGYYYESGGIPYLVVFKENVYLVLVYFNGRVVKKVKFHSFQINERKETYWKDERGIDHCIFYLGWNNNMSFNTSLETLHCDCIYVSRPCDDGEFIYKICLDKEIMGFSIVHTLMSKDRSKSCWIVPSKTRRIKWETSKSSRILRSIEKNVEEGSNYKEEEKFSDISRKWTEMPVEMLELILSKLSLVDRIYFPTICKAWSSVTNHLQKAKVWPWLMYCPKDASQCKFMDPFYGREYCMDLTSSIFCMNLTSIPDSAPLNLHFSKDGLVLLSTDNRYLLVVNPFTRNVIKLSCRYNYNACVLVLSFNSIPSSSDFIVFGIWDNRLASWTPQEKYWRNAGEVYIYIIQQRNNLVFFRGEVYSLENTGCLSVFDIESGERRVLNRPAPIHSEEPADGSEDCYLIEFEGELISVFHGTKGMEDPIRVYKLDQSEMNWIELLDLGDLTLFLDRKSPMAKRSPLKSYANRIYLPRFDDKSKHVVFYSMESHKYYPKAYNMTEPVNFVWIEPNLNS